MAFLDKTGLQTLTNKLVQGDAIKVASHRGKNVKEVIDNIQRECESIALPNTMTLENRVSEFKVGESRDVDVSGDVEEGKVEVELQGKTYQNLIKENQSYTKDLVTTNHTGFLFPKYDLKSNVTYTIMFNVSNLVKDGNDSVYCIFRGNNDSNVFIQFDAFYVEKNGVFAQKFTLANGLKNFLIGVSGSSNKNNPSFTIGDIMILEGDYTQTPTEELPSYFEGIKSSFEDGIVVIDVQGKNLFDKNSKDIIKGRALAQHNGLYDDPLLFSSGLIKVAYNKCYSFTNLRWGWLVDKNGDKMADINWKKMHVYRIPYGCEYIRVTGNIDKLDVIQIEQGSVASQYEDFNSEKLSFNIGEPLRSLPNGVCDEVVGDKLVRRVGKIVFDGSQNINLLSHDSEHVRRWIPFTGKPKPKSNGKQINTFTSVEGTAKDTTKTNDFLGIDVNSNVVVGVQSSKLNTQDTEGFKQWLSKNPITVYYELAEPIITPIEPIEFNISQGTTVNISSDISPTSTHKVILNRAGQIEQGIELIANLKSRVNALESIYDSNLIATQYKLDNLKLNYELEREED